MGQVLTADFELVVRHTVGNQDIIISISQIETSPYVFTLWFLIRFQEVMDKNQFLVSTFKQKMINASEMCL